MSDEERTILREMLVTDLRGRLHDVTQFKDRHARYVVSQVVATLVGYGLETERTYSTETAPRVGDLVDVIL